MIEHPHELSKGRKLVVQMVETYGANKKPVFVDSLDAVKVKDESGLAVTPVMITATMSPTSSPRKASLTSTKRTASRKESKRSRRLPAYRPWAWRAAKAM
ncbi:hypothetical protein HMSSN036_01160 [Paenibacillus macerans]|nr:hypothetical protein HMSSN036_01160 [Paenibacillus macerans]